MGELEGKEGERPNGTRLPHRMKRRKRQLRNRRTAVTIVAAAVVGLLSLGTVSTAIASEALTDESSAPVVQTETTTTGSAASEGTPSDDGASEVQEAQQDASSKPAEPAIQPVTAPEEAVIETPDVAPAPQQVARQAAAAPVNYGTIGDLQPFSSDGNKASYWVSRIPNAIECYKYDGGAMTNNDHAYLTNGGKTVVLKPYGASWPGDHWAGLIVKAATWDAVTYNPTAGTNYAAYDNKDISHYIVCKGNAPEQPKPTVTITGDKQCVAASGTYTVTWTVTIANNGSLNEVDLKAISHSPSGSLINGINGQVWFYEWLAHHANHGLPAFPQGGTFTFTQSNIPGTATAASVTIQYDFKNGPSGDPVGTVTLGGDCTPPPPPTDVCKNIDGNQETVPDGHIGVGEKCYLVKTRLEKGEWEKGEPNCEVGTITLTRTVWTVKYYVKHGQEVEVSRSSDTESKARALNEGEIEECKPDTPDPLVTYTEWTDGEKVCDATTVTQTRTTITTPWKVVRVGDFAWAVVEDTENIATAVEPGTRDLKPEEIVQCENPPTEEPEPTPTVTPTPTPTVTPSPTATPVPAATSLPPTGGSVPWGWIATGATLLVAGGAGVLVQRRRRV